MWPSTVTRVSYPVRPSISSPSRSPTPRFASRRVPELVDLALVVGAGKLAALADDDDREVLAAWRGALAISLQTSSKSTGRSGMRMTSAPPAMPLCTRDPAGVAAHHLDDHDAVVRLGGRVQPVDRLGADRDRGVEAEGVVGAGEVVVDRLRDADDRRAEVRVQPRRDAERVLAADRDERVDCSNAARTASTPPSTLYGFVRDVPMIVPPRGRIPEICDAAERLEVAARSSRASPRGRRSPRGRAPTSAARPRG